MFCYITVELLEFGVVANANQMTAAVTETMKHVTTMLLFFNRNADIPTQ